MAVPEGGYMVLMFVRGPEASAEVMDDADEYRTLTLNFIHTEAAAVGRVQIFQAA